MQLIILGMHRSGTSMQARLLNLAGAYFAPEGASTGANEENPKGFWERRDVRTLNDRLLHSAGCEWDRAVDFRVDKVSTDTLEYFNRSAARIVLNMDAYRPWVLKEPRLCLLLPLWRPLLECPIAVHVLRHPVEVAASLLRRNNIPMEVGLAMWKLHLGSAVAASRGMPGVLSFHADFMTDPHAAASELVEQLQQLGVPSLRVPSRVEVEAFVSRDFYRERLPQLEFDRRAAASEIELFEHIRRSRTLPDDVMPTDEERDVLRNFESGLPPLEAVIGKESAMDAAKRTIGELKGSVTRRDRRIKQLEGELAGQRERLQLERSALSSSLERAEAEAATEKAEGLRRSRELVGLTRLLVSREHQLHEHRARLRRVEAAARADRRRLDARADEVQQLGTRLEVSSRRSQVRIEALDAELQRMRRSPLWRLGAPVRWVARKVAAARGIGLAGDIRQVLDSGLFDRAWYLSSYPDVAQAGLDPTEHFLLHGAEEGRNPGPGFNTLRYVEKYPDVAGSGMNPLLHFIRHGRGEGRLPL